MSESSGSFLTKSSFLVPNDLVPSAWTEHAPFAFWLVERLEPRVFVERGADLGSSYFAVCQAVDALGLATACYAVDPWLGDGDDVHRSVVRTNQKYGSFSKLIRKTFHDAASAFADASIDLLHIDGRRCGENVRTDFEAWRPKLSDRGIVLVHGTRGDDRDVVVRRLFDALRTSHPVFEFLHGHGLGVVAIGEIPAALEPLFTADEATTQFVRDAYSALGRNLRHRGESEKALDFARRDRTSALESERREHAAASADAATRTAATHAHIEASYRKALIDQRDDFMRYLSQLKRPKPVSGLPPQLRRRSPFASRDAAYKGLVQDYETLASSPLFDRDWYLAKYPDVAERGDDPVHHYLTYGGIYPMSPGPLFDTFWYLDRNPDVQRAGVNPLLHFIRHGAAEERSLGFAPSPDIPPLKDSKRRKAHEVALRCVKEPRIADENALLVTYTRDGRVKPHVVAHVRALRDHDISVTLIVATDDVSGVDVEDLVDLTDGLYARKDAGVDFAAWAHILSERVEFFSSRLLYLTSDSLFGPTSLDKLEHLLYRIRASDAGMLALTERDERGGHPQSAFLALKTDALTTLALHRFFADVECLESRDEAVQTYEIELASLLRERKVKLEILFPTERLGLTKRPLEAGSPYVHVNALATASGLEIDTSGSSERLARDAYDASLAHAARRPWAKPVSALRVAFIGPWNYGSGLGFSSRSYLSALWHCRFSLGIHPITTPFHVHPRVAPTVSVCDFAGDADVVLMHLNPDGWGGLLSEQHREIVAKARRLIGLWVWEMNELPESWQPGLEAVHAIWAPTQFCADVFARQARPDVPVSVVPYVVQLPPQLPTPLQLRETRRRCDIPETGRIVLYCFDGSSYLIRKNPFALISAFKRSGLADEGWLLVLKTKNMYEYPLQAEKLEGLVADCPNAMLLNRPMTRQDLSLLMHSADIYASPHCSEGFGLTIAEAMAASKHVVATNYGGSCDFVDETCGYPVDFTLSPLADDHGHYTTGKYWADVDVDAFAQALRTAAEAISRGDFSLAEAARARIADRYSAHAIARRIEATLADLH